MTITEAGQQLFDRAMAKITEENRNYERRINDVMVVGQLARDFCVLRSHEVNAGKPELKYHELEAIYRLADGGFVFRGARIYFQDKTKDMVESRMLEDDEARNLRNYLEVHVPSPEGEYPSYSVMHNTLKSLAQALDQPDEDQLDAILNAVHRTYLDHESRDCLDDDPGEDAPDPFGGGPVNLWPELSLDGYEFPNVSFSHIPAGISTEVTQEIVVKINGKKIKGKRKVYKIEAIEGE